MIHDRGRVSVAVVGITAVSRIVQSLVGSTYVQYITSEINMILVINLALSD